MNHRTRFLLNVAGMFLLALGWCLVSTLVILLLMVAVPHPAQGPAAEQAMAVCFGIVFAVQFAVPAALVFVYLRSRRLRIACLLATAGAVLTVHYVLRGIDFLNRAWAGSGF